MNVEKIEKWGKKGKKDKLIGVLNNPKSKFRAAAAKAMGQVKDEDVVNNLVSAIRDPEPEVRAAVAESLGILMAKNAEEHIRRMLNAESDEEVKKKASEALDKIRNTVG